MNYNEIVKFSEAELDKRLMELKEELLNLRFQHAINQLENPMRLKFVKKDIAKIKTEIRQRELAQAKQ